MFSFTQIRLSKNDYSLFVIAIMKAVYDMSGDNVDKIITALITRGLCDKEKAFTYLILILISHTRLSVRPRPFPARLGGSNSA